MLPCGINLSAVASKEVHKRQIRDVLAVDPIITVLYAYDLVSEPELRKAAAKTLKGFCAT